MPKVREIPPRDSPSLYLSVRRAFPTPREAALSLAAAILTVLSFPNFNLWFLAWAGLAPLLIAIVSTRTALRAFVLGWLYGIVFFYGTCWWLTYPMIHYAHISAWFAYPLFLLPVGFVACFPALFCAVLSLLIRRLGSAAVYFGPPLWVSIDWLRYVVTG